jgi:hypothetical protein
MIISWNGKQTFGRQIWSNPSMIVKYQLWKPQIKKFTKNLKRFPPFWFGYHVIWLWNKHPLFFLFVSKSGNSKLPLQPLWGRKEGRKEGSYINFWLSPCWAKLSVTSATPVNGILKYFLLQLVKCTVPLLSWAHNLCYSHTTPPWSNLDPWI